MAATTMRLIAKNVLGSDTSSVSFSNIPQSGYTDLLLVGSTRSSYADWRIAGGLRFNSDATANAYTSRLLYGQSTTAASASYTTDFGYGIESTASSGTTNTFGSWEVYVPNFAGATNKSWSASATSESNTATVGNTNIQAWAGIWSNTSAITSIILFPGGGSNFVSGSSFFLYAITKA